MVLRPIPFFPLSELPEINDSTSTEEGRLHTAVFQAVNRQPAYLSN